MSGPESRNAECGGMDGVAPSGTAVAAEVWREHRGWVAAVIRANMPRDAAADADDLLQEVAVKLVQHIDSLNSPDRIGPWLRTVAVNLARTAGRRHVRAQRIFQPMSEREPAGRATRGRAPTEHTDSASRGRAALQIAETLPPHYREPLLLSLRGLSYKQIALAMDVPISTIETRLSRARAMVREELGAMDERERACEHAVEAGRHEPAKAQSSKERKERKEASAIADETSHE